MCTYEVAEDEDRIPDIDVGGYMENWVDCSVSFVVEIVSQTMKKHQLYHHFKLIFNSLTSYCNALQYLQFKKEHKFSNLMMMMMMLTTTMMNGYVVTKH